MYVFMVFMAIMTKWIIIWFLSMIVSYIVYKNETLMDCRKIKLYKQKQVVPVPKAPNYFNYNGRK